MRSGRLSVMSKGNFAKWLWDKLRVVREGGKLPGSTSFRWFLSKFNQISRRKDLKKLGGTLVKSFSPKKIVLTVSFRCKKLISSNSAISFLEKKKMLNKMSFHCFKKLYLFVLTWAVLVIGILLKKLNFFAIHILNFFIYYE